MISEQVTQSRPEAAERGITLPIGKVGPYILLLAIAALSALLNFANLSQEGYNNEFYAAAVRSMSENWHNFFFAAFDPGGFVTIDKPPLGFWFQVAGVKLFGFNGVSLLIPEALAGVLSVLLLYYLVSRTFGRTAGLIAALALAVTPISVVTSRNNTIDSILVLFVLLGAWAVLRAAETGRLRWLLLCAAFVGLGFNIKMLEAYLVVPAFGLVYLLGANTRLGRRLPHLGLALVVLVAISLSWAVAVDSTPASARPWVDSTTTNSEVDLAIGYNGLQRLTGSHSVGTANSTGPSGARFTASTGGGTASKATGQSGAPSGGFGGPGGGPGGVGENGPTGVLRLLDTQLGSQIGWFLPLAILGFLVAFWQTRPRLRALDDRQRSLVLWGVWLLTTGVFFSIALFYHTYYLVMVSPAAAALTGIGIAALWHAYRTPGSRTWWLLPIGLVAGALVQAHILGSYPSYALWLTPLVIGASLLVALTMLVLRLRPRLLVPVGTAGVALASLGLVTSPAVFAAYTTQHTQTGAIVRAGPSARGVSSGFGGGPGGPPSGAGAFQPPTGSSARSSLAATSGSSAGARKTPTPGSASSLKGTAARPSRTARSSVSTQPSSKAQGSASRPPSGAPQGGAPPSGAPNGTLPGPPPGNGAASPIGSPGEARGAVPPATPKASSKSRSTSSSRTRTGSRGVSKTRPSARGSSTSGSRAGRFPSTAFGGPPGGFAGPGGPGGDRANSRLIAYLGKHQGGAKYLVATSSSNEAAPIIIATGKPVMSLGGFTGSDPILTTARLKTLVRQGVVRYFLVGRAGPGGSNKLMTWVEQHSKVINVAGTQLYEYTG